MSVILDWVNDLRSVLDDQDPLVQAVEVGVFYTGIQIASGHTGVAFTPRDLADTVCCPKTAAAAPPAGHMLGQHAWQLADFAFAESPLRRAIGIATLNALSALAISQQGILGGRLLEGLDALEAAEVKTSDRVAMVGAFTPYIKTLKGRVASLSIVDKHPKALKSDEQHFWMPPERAAEALGQASIAIISGSALVEGGLDALLSAASSARRVIIAGPTAPLWGRPFFKRGVHALGGIRVHDTALLLRLVAEGGSGYFFEKAAEKVTVVSDGRHVRSHAA